ncbi:MULTISPECIES: M28 family peptidase [Spongiibacter]|uniref:M28 family peptidase n=1 Tax=Spongiibacter TaxID=630749 RepID=UPI000C4A8790|nr:MULTISPECIES: M28 family peptidase [Spongiibacter]MAY37410.1 PA domain protein [Spongiibacter sp.]MBI57643.1 PA domain protein [Spongiibacter sp.]|tara:strand:- start:790 stop:2313 length:1524 start_codon:yes stop_codon:yes gene_type:complete
MNILTRILTAILLSVPCSGWAGEGWPGSALSAEDAMTVRADQFVSADQHRDWQVDLDQRGLRAAGSTAHEAYIDVLRERLIKAGIPNVYEEPVTLKKWEVGKWSLEVIGNADTDVITLPTASFVPYSGGTPQDGVRGRLELVQSDNDFNGDKLKGNVALIPLSKPKTTLEVFAEAAFSLHGFGQYPASARPYERTYFSTSQMAKKLDALKQAGAIGAVFILDEPASNALGLYAPYDGESRGVPALYVDKNVGHTLLTLAERGFDVRLMVDAKIRSVNSRNLIGVIPGASDELIVLNSHTDGPNGIEDNGPNVIVAMAQYLSRLPREALPRSVMVLLTTGHFAGAQGGQAFVDAHLDDETLGKIAALLCLEHLGAEEWVQGPGGRWMPTGKAEPYVFFMPNIPALIAAAKDAVNRADSAPTIIRGPTRPQGGGYFHDHVWPGEGQVFWGRVRIPTANYIAGPNYLFNWGISTADKVDYQRLQRETMAFTEMTLRLARTPMGQLREFAE